MKNNSAVLISIRYRKGSSMHSQLRGNNDCTSFKIMGCACFHSGTEFTRFYTVDSETPLKTVLHFAVQSFLYSL
jgi:hypothetical protein